MATGMSAVYAMCLSLAIVVIETAVPEKELPISMMLQYAGIEPSSDDINGHRALPDIEDPMLALSRTRLSLEITLP